MALTFGMARAILESSFMPLSCRCSHESSAARIRIYDATTGEPQLIVAGININGTGTYKEVSKLVSELRHELAFFEPRLHRTDPVQFERVKSPCITTRL